jgi:hypothetical protein
MMSHYNTWWEAIEAEVQEAGLGEEEAADRWATLAAKSFLKKHKIPLSDNEGQTLPSFILACSAWLLMHHSENF